MKSIYCVLPYLVLGAALTLPLYVLLTYFCRSRRPPPPQPAPAILWLTPHCAEALGACAAPGNLRRMSSDDIAKRLDRITFPVPDEKPTPSQYGSWPTQAQHLHAGEYEKLRLFQVELQRSAIGGKGAARVDHAPGRYNLFLLLLMMLALLLTSVGLYVSWRYPTLCLTTTPCDHPTGTDTKKTTLSFDTDMLFEYNRSTPVSDTHTLKAKQNLSRLLSQYRDIQSIGLSAQTDPIGSEIFNSTLAKNRAEFVREMLEEISAQSPPGVFLERAVPIKLLGESQPNQADYELWNRCFRKFQLEVPNKPLEDLPADRNPRNRPLCLQVTNDVAPGQFFPACRRLMAPKPREDDKARKIPRAELVAYAERAENFRELTSCLAPMRHVLITFKHTQ